VATLGDGPQLLAYPDSLGGTLGSLANLLDGPLDGLFTGVHVLPPYPSTGDRGFAPTTYAEIEPRFGTWADIERLAERHDVVLDVMVNHLSRSSAEFRDVVRLGPSSPCAPIFLTPERVWGGGEAPPDDLARLARRRAAGPFSTVEVGPDRQARRFWTTFGRDDPSEQVDLDVTVPETRALLERWLSELASHGVAMVRLDAAGYVTKRAGTSCFMVEPEIWSFLSWIRAAAAARGLEVLPEVHDVPATRDRLAGRGDWTYDFALPALVLDALTAAPSQATEAAARLAAHLSASPHRQITMLDCHDGIPVRPDLDGLVSPETMRRLERLVLERGGNVSRLFGASPEPVDIHQLNIAYLSALGGDEERLLLARAIQLFAPGIPQVYYVGLLGGENDAAAMSETGDGRAINRHDFTPAEIEARLRRPAVQRTLEVIRLRRDNRAFQGELQVRASSHTLSMSWQLAGDRATLLADLAAGTFEIKASGAGIIAA